MPAIKERLDQLLTEITQAASGHPVTLVAVSKTKPIQMLLKAYQAGQVHFGENKVQEAQEKQPQMPAGAVFHLIGPLQKNKAKACPPVFDWVHTLDRLDVAQKLQDRYDASQKNLNVLVQVNLTGETHKSGIVDLDQLESFCETLLGFSRLRLRGLMTIGDPGLEEKKNRALFAKLRQLKESVSIQLGVESSMNQLSMGMSQDWKWALDEGATLLRIGRAIFGNRSDPL